MTASDRRGWDACCIIALLREEREHLSALRNIIEDAEHGRVEIVVSTVAIAEVVRAKCPTMTGLDLSYKEVVRDTFKKSYVIVVPLTEWVAEKARELSWSRGIHPRDAIHIATAIHAKCPVLETADGDLITKCSGIEGLEVRKPKWIGTPSVFDEGDDPIRESAMT